MGGVALKLKPWRTPAFSELVYPLVIGNEHACFFWRNAFVPLKSRNKDWCDNVFMFSSIFDMFNLMNVHVSVKDTCNSLQSFSKDGSWPKRLTEFTFRRKKCKPFQWVRSPATSHGIVSWNTTFLPKNIHFGQILWVLFQKCDFWEPRDQPLVDRTVPLHSFLPALHSPPFQWINYHPKLIQKYH